MTRHPVIALCGIPGAGKSRATAALARRIGATALAFDDFETLTQSDPAEVQAWLAAGAPFARMYDPALESVLDDLSRQGPVVFETPLGRIPPAQDRLITRAIWLEVDRDIALARKLQATLGMDAWTDAEELTGWLGGFLASYQALVRPCLDHQAGQVRARADAVIDGMAPPDRVDAAIAAVLGDVPGLWPGR